MFVLNQVQHLIWQESDQILSITACVLFFPPFKQLSGVAHYYIWFNCEILPLNKCDNVGVGKGLTPACRRTEGDRVDACSPRRVAAS